MPAVDICGITNTDDAKWAAIHGVEYVTLSMDPDSPRKLSTGRARSIAEMLPAYTRLAVDFGSADNIDLKVLEKISPSLVKFYLPGESGELEKAEQLLSGKDYKIVIKSKEAEELSGEFPFPDCIRQLQLREELEEDKIKDSAGMLENYRLMVQGDFQPDRVKKLCGLFKPAAWCIEEAITASPRRIDYGKMKKYIREISLI